MKPMLPTPTAKAAGKRSQMLGAAAIPTIPTPKRTTDPITCRVGTVWRRAVAKDLDWQPTVGPDDETGGNEG